jgi:hypothetical protein
VSVITEDWKYRMVTPRRGVFDAIPLSAEGRKVGQAWDPARDAAAGEQCRAYGAAGIMRMPTRLNVTWENETTLRIDTDAGTQTRRLYFGTAPAPGERSWQGHSVAMWEYGPGGARVPRPSRRPRDRHAGRRECRSRLADDPLADHGLLGRG